MVSIQRFVPAKKELKKQGALSPLKPRVGLVSRRITLPTENRLFRQTQIIHDVKIALQKGMSPKKIKQMVSRVSHSFMPPDVAIAKAKELIKKQENIAKEKKRKQAQKEILRNFRVKPSK